MELLLKQATYNKQPPLTEQQLTLNRLREGLLIFVIALAVFMLVALVSYHGTDPSWSHQSLQTAIKNAGGKTGAWLADLSFYFFGITAYLFPLLIAYGAWTGLRLNRLLSDYRLWLLRAVGFAFTLLASSGLASLAVANYPTHYFPEGAGGVLGQIMGLGLATLFNVVGSSLLLVALLLSGLTLCTGLSWLSLTHHSMQWIKAIVPRLNAQFVRFLQWIKPATKPVESTVKTLPRERKLPRIQPDGLESVACGSGTMSGSVVIESEPDSFKSKSATFSKPKKKEPHSSLTTNALPALSLLDTPKKSGDKGYSTSFLETMSRSVEEKLRDFGIDAQVVAVHPGPVITRFELQLAPGIKVSKISNLAKDLARSLSMVSVRIVDIIPGKSVIGLELPNQTREVVRLKEIFASSHYQQAQSSLSLALGKDIAGHPMIVDLAKMPHLLVAGTTGSGKSVGLNAMLLSILYKASPDQVRLIMIDPKMLELSVYADIPHLLTPVVTDMKEAQSALRWCVAEMERRYKLMSLLGVRNLTSFNQKVNEAATKKAPIRDPLSEDESYLSPLPVIVVVIDELADMMMVVGKKVEELIARIAQKARAAGIHMVLATQRPSVDVLTGLIKANIPTRIAFQVSSKIDSRTILDQQGAEQLLGYGDMLYLAPGAGLPVRVHGAFVSDQEVHAVVNALKQQSKPNYVTAVLVKHADPQQAESVEASDPLYDQAVEFVLKSRRASISSVQRHLKIGYNRAARLVEQMEQIGLVSAMESNGNRDVLVPEPVDTAQ